MKFSVLIPTRNRLKYLKYAVASVLQQDEGDFEVIISDNYSEDDIKGYVDSLNDPRIKYFRTDSFVSVTENWNNALNKSSGDWIVMLGDDDCLMKGYFTTLSTLLSQFADIDFIYMHSFLYAYPNVLPGADKGVASTLANAGFVINQKGPYLLSKEEAINLVKQTFNFKCVFSFNMQFALMKREFAEKLKREGSFFHSPYPDYYAMTSLMLFGNRILACPYPLVCVGISPKSFGYYYLNDIESKGVDFLNNKNYNKEFPNLKNIIFPGTEMNTSWLLSLEKIKSNFPECRFSINYQKYRLLQIIACLKRFHKFPHENRDFHFWKKLTLKEKCLYGVPWILMKYLPSYFRQKYINFLSKITESYVVYPSKRIDQDFENIQQFFESIDPLKETSYKIT